MSEDIRKTVSRRFRWVASGPLKLTIAGGEAVQLDPDQVFSVSGSPASVASALQELIAVSAAKGYGSVLEIEQHDEGVRRRAGFHPWKSEE